MSLTTLTAHFDGEKICFDEPFLLKPNAKLIVTILSDNEVENLFSGVPVGELPAIWNALPHLSTEEIQAFEKDLQAIRIQFNREELENPWES